LRRPALLLASSAIWLFLAATPVLADNGPHRASVNSGTGGLTADSCAACHRAHTAQGELLLLDQQPAVCLVCHGSSGTGATTDVEDGLQFSAGVAHSDDPAVSTGVAGALRGGGFAQARIGSSNPTRLSYQVPSTPNGSGFTGIVPVASTGVATTSRHMNLDGSPFGPSSAWGNYQGGFFNYSTDPWVGATVSLTCTSCHNPHGNRQYRILIPIPFGAPNTPTDFYPSAAQTVTDALDVPPGQVRNYTNSPALYLTGPSGIPPSYVPDYWRYCTPWNTCNSSTQYEKPNGLAQFRGQISKWCSSCHTRYLAGGGSPTYDNGDAIYRYQHTTTIFPGCTQCHVAHGSNAAMGGTYSSDFPYPHDPDATAGTIVTSPSSRLLKIDNRGTCQMCHDPTGTVTASGVYSPPTPAP
jgi:predicted CXXCH cytochrome family protein